MSAATKPIVCAIGGLDPSGHAGLLADVRTVTDLGCHGCTITTSITLQNSRACVAADPLNQPDLQTQWTCLLADQPPRAVKVGLCLSDHQWTQLQDCQRAHPQLHWVQDPVASASQAGTTLTRPRLLPGSIFTPNLPELSQLLGRPISTPADTARAARDCLRLGARAVLVKGGHGADAHQVADYFCSPKTDFWLSGPRLTAPHTRGTGCVLSSALAAFLAQGKALEDAVVLACAYVRQGLRLGYAPGSSTQAGPLGAGGWPLSVQDFPRLHRDAVAPSLHFNSVQSPGLYVLVDSVAWLERLLKAGVKTLQLRIKHLHGPALNRAIAEAIALGRAHQAQVFINDHWRRALALGAWGVHLGQEDVRDADLPALMRAGIRLGISAHSEAQWCRALALSPSYIALGAAYASTSKAVPVVPPLDLRRWLATLQPALPVVVIGGVNRHTLPELVGLGVRHVAVISAITGAEDPEAELVLLTQQLVGAPSTAAAT